MKSLTGIFGCTIIMLCSGGIFSSCNTKTLEAENANLVNELDSINNELKTNQNAMAALEEITTLLDTIEAQRNMMRFEMVEGGIRYDDYIARIKNLNASYEQAVARVSELEAARSSFRNLVNKLQKDLKEKQQQIQALEALVTDTQAENMSLQTTVSLQESEIEDLELEITLAEQELEFMDSKIQDMVDQAQLSEADAFYARAVAYEEAAERTKFAPRKKKETLRHALELFQQALALGNEDARTKVDELTKKLE